MFRQSTFPFLLTAGWLLAGCVSQVPYDYVPSATDANGIVVFSVSHDEEGGGSTQAIVYLDGGVFRGGSQYSSVRAKIPFGHEDSDFDTAEGQVYVISLPAGDHIFTNWQVASSGHRFYPKRVPAEQRFHVERGSIQYLGNFHGKLFRGRSLLGITVTGSALVLVKDEHEHDLVTLAKRYPQYRTKISTSLLNPEPWVNSAEIESATDSPDPVVHPK